MRHATTRLPAPGAPVRNQQRISNPARRRLCLVALVSTFRMNVQNTDQNRHNWRRFRQRLAPGDDVCVVSCHFGTGPASTVSMKADETIPAPQSNGASRLILVVDDQEHERTFITDSLRLNGFSCRTASSVAEANDLLQSTLFALTILDWGLDRCGSEVLRAARVLQPQMPVLVVSGRPYDARTDALIEQADAFLEKPLSATVLQCQVRQLLQRAEAARQTLLPRRMEDIRPIAEIKEAYVLQALQLVNHNLSLAAEKLGIHRQTVGTLLKRASCAQTLDNET